MIQRKPRSTLFPYTVLFLFFFNDTATTEIYTLSLHDALPIFCAREPRADLMNHRQKVFRLGQFPTRKTDSSRDCQKRHQRYRAHRNGPEHPGLAVPGQFGLRREAEI